MSQIPEWTNGVGEGWKSILYKLHKQLFSLDPEYDVAQIKEKFGGLRVYLNYYDKPNATMEWAETYIRQAEEQAAKTCELCGATGNDVCTRPPPQRRHGWIRTTCDKCQFSRPVHGG